MRMVDANISLAQLAFDWPLHLRLAATVGALGLNVHLISGFLFATFFTILCRMDGLYQLSSRGGSLRYSHSYLKVGVWAVLFTEARDFPCLGLACSRLFPGSRFGMPASHART